MDFDLVLDEIGEFGRYQQTNYLLLCFPVLFGAANSLSYVFTAGIPNYRCFVPGCDNSEDPIYDSDWIQNAIPGTTNSQGMFTPEQCIRFQRENHTDMIRQQSTAVMLDNEKCMPEMFSNERLHCNEWVYDKYEATIVQEWDITCSENQWMLALVGTMHFAGIVVGSSISGILADRFGRKLIFVLCILFMSITGIGQALSNSYIMFIIFAFLNAVGTAGVYPLAFIIAVEMVGSSKREMSGIVLNYFYAIGEAAVGLISWLCRDWITLQYIISAPPLLFLIYYWFIPESVRWLLARNNTLKAGKIIQKAARINGVTLSDNIVQLFELKPKDNEYGASMIKTANIDDKRSHDILRTVRELMGSKILLTRCLILFYIWATNAFVYYGLSLNSTSLSGNKYLNFALVCLIEIPGYTMAWIGMNKIGRRKSLAGSLLLCAVTCVGGAFMSEDYTWALIILFLMGKLGITSAFGIVYVHSAEMLPTIIRSGGVGTMSTVARIGALVAPFVPLLNNIFAPLPLLLFGSVSFFGGLLALLLPETLGYKLPDTVEEAEKIGKDYDDIELNTTDNLNGRR